ncbi:hypothetical protein SAMN05892883_4240 [Jatrophihabitans sp. GAS493]|nr:hypothetical protein SAMN05892883_4240 [Jatrophihabitans sp. GAS493]
MISCGQRQRETTEVPAATRCRHGAELQIADHTHVDAWITAWIAAGERPYAAVTGSRRRAAMIPDPTSHPAAALDPPTPPDGPTVEAS